MGDFFEEKKNNQRQFRENIDRFMKGKNNYSQSLHLSSAKINLIKQH